VDRVVPRAAPVGPVPRDGGQGGGRGEAATSTELTALLAGSTTRWAAVTVSAQSASVLELASGGSVMAVGGFPGSDAAPSLAQFQAHVAAGDIGYFVASGNGQGGGSGALRACEQFGVL
jgi:hypothetical protein